MTQCNKWKPLLSVWVFTYSTAEATVQHCANNGEFSIFCAVLHCYATCVGGALHRKMNSLTFEPAFSFSVLVRVLRQLQQTDNTSCGSDEMNNESLVHLMSSSLRNVSNDWLYLSGITSSSGASLSNQRFHALSFEVTCKWHQKRFFAMPTDKIGISSKI